MKILNSVIVLCLGITYIPSGLAATESATTIDSSCRQDRQDIGDKGWRLSAESQKYRGQCLTTKSVRPVVKVSETSQQLVFQNFYHQGRYWTARWDKADTVKVRYLGVHFDVAIPLVKPAHTELRFSFRRGLQLTSQDSVKSGPVVIVKDVIISWEAVFPHDVSYDFMTGTKPNYGLAGRVLSLQARIPENFVPGEKLRQVDQYELDFSAKEAAALFRFSIDRSHSMGLRYFYSTLRQNCTDMMFANIDQVLRQMRGQNPQAFRTPPTPDPIIGPAHRALVYRKLITTTQEKIDLATELKLRPQNSHALAD